MPELPEVENVRRALTPLIIGERIASLEIPYPKMVRSPLDDFRKAAIGASFVKIERRGKYLIFVLDNGKAILSHLRMEGHYRFEDGYGTLGKHDLLAFRFESGRSLVYNDVRRFGIMEMHTYPGIYGEEPLRSLGKEPSALSTEEFRSSLRNKRLPIKEAIMDQKIIAGIGNIYADESLFRSGISPFRHADALSSAESAALLSAIQDVIEEAIEKGGSTVRSYKPLEGKTGHMQDSLLAYGRGDKPCVRCGATLKKAKVGGRGTTYCPHCQRNDDEPYVIGISGPIASGKSYLSALLREHGWTEIDADKAVHHLYETKKVAKEIAGLFGDDVLTTDGKIDRAALLKIVSDDPKKREALEHEIHPLVYQYIEKRLQKAHGKNVVLNIPLLFCTPFESLCDATILVTIDPVTQKTRLRKRGTKDPERALKLNASYPLKEAKERASYIYRSEDVSEEEAWKRLMEIPFLH